LVSAKSNASVHPYIPNSVPEVRSEMLREIGAKDVEGLLTVIPERLRVKRPLNLPQAISSEFDLRAHVEGILSKNKTTKDYLNFLGAGCWQHYVPAVCDEIATRQEFVTAYGGDAYSDFGKWQSWFEFQSMLGEILDMDMVSIPTYDWGNAAGYALRMASRINGRKEVLVPKTCSPERLAILRTYCEPRETKSHMEVKLVDYDEGTGLLDLEDLKRKISKKTAAVYFENPSYIGLVESQGKAIAQIAHERGAESVVGVDPISLGVLASPGSYGADIVCGDLQPLGIHMYTGGGLGGFLANRDVPRYSSQNPLLLVSIASTGRKGEFGFGYSAFERTPYVVREKGLDYVGTTVGLWAIVAGVYLALMGPKGMREVGEKIVQGSHYAAKRLAEIDGVEVPFSPRFFKEFVVRFRGRRSVREINRSLLERKIFGGKDLTKEFPEFGKSALYCVTEVHTKAAIDRLADGIGRALR
jgi:glycine dehydrogenase subunit 1